MTYCLFVHLFVTLRQISLQLNYDFLNSESSGSCLQKRIDEYCQGTVKDACPNFGYARYNTDKVKIEVQK